MPIPPSRSYARVVNITSKSKTVSMSSGFCKHSNITLRYINYYDSITNQTYKLPMAHARLIHKRETLETTALIDSGATTNFLPKELAEILGIDLSGKHKNAIGAGGEFTSVKTIVGKYQLVKSRNIVFNEFVNLSINVPTRQQTLPYMVLGRDSIFRYFIIKFMENKEEISSRRAK